MASIRVGSGQPFPQLPDAIAAARPHDVLFIYGSVEVTDSLHVRVPLTIVGIAARPALVARGLLRGGKAILHVHADVTIRNLEFRNARALTGNGAGLWHEAGNVTVEDCQFIENQNGVVGAGGTTDVLTVSGCSFIRNGAGCGHTHGIYANQIGALVVTRCLFEDTAVGHHIKSRASMLRVERSHFAGGAACSASYAIDASNGGKAFITRSQFVKGRNAMSRTFIAYCPEGRAYDDNRIEVVSNLFINRRRGPTVALVNRCPSVTAILRGNAYEGVALSYLGRGRQTHQLAAEHVIAVGLLEALPNHGVQATLG